MPLVRPIQQATFEPAPQRYGRKLTLIVRVHDFPFVGNKGRRSLHGSQGWWYLSRAAVELQVTVPIRFPEHDESSEDVYSNGNGHSPDGNLWLFNGWVHFTDDMQLDAEDVRALINVEVNKRRLTLGKAHALQAMSDHYDKPKRRESIPQAARVEVWQRDGGRCVDCDSQEKLEFDHIIPVAMGGGNTSRNLQLLCETCNRRKGASLG